MWARAHAITCLSWKGLPRHTKNPWGKIFCYPLTLFGKPCQWKLGFIFWLGTLCVTLSVGKQGGGEGDHDGQNLFSRPKSFCMILLHCLLNAKLLFKCLRNNNCFVILVSTVAFMSKLSLVQLKRYWSHQNFY